VTVVQARDFVCDPCYVGSLMVYQGSADDMVTQRERRGRMP
jgi:phosphotransacetylase